MSLFSRRSHRNCSKDTDPPLQQLPRDRPPGVSNVEQEASTKVEVRT